MPEPVREAIKRKMTEFGVDPAAHDQHINDLEAAVDEWNEDKADNEKIAKDPVLQCFFQIVKEIPSGNEEDFRSVLNHFRWLVTGAREGKHLAEFTRMLAEIIRLQRKEGFMSDLSELNKLLEDHKSSYETMY